MPPVSCFIFILLNLDIVQLMHTIRPFRRRQKKYIIEDSRQNYNYNLCYQKVMYNIGTEILMLQ